MKIQAYALQDIGKRDNQEDAFYPSFLSPGVFGKEGRYDTIPHTDDRLFILCDGMGGHEHGEVASATVCEVMGKSLREAMGKKDFDADAAIAKAVNEALDALDAKSLPPFGRVGMGSMGCTMTLLLFHDNGATIAHIGDSRVYHFRPSCSAAALPSESCKGQILFRTEDHSYVNMLVHSGVITLTQARSHPKRNVLMRAMQANEKPRPVADIHHISDVRPGDVFFLCSDGMIEELYDEDLCSILTNPAYSETDVLQILLKYTEKNKDNHTAWIVKVGNEVQEKKPVVQLNKKEKRESRNMWNKNVLPKGTQIKGISNTYTVEKVLGQGAYGITYLATMPVSLKGELSSFESEVNVTLKEFFMEEYMERRGTTVVRKNTMVDIDTSARCFYMEADKLSTLSHPNIVKVLEVFTANDTCYYVMEYLPGGSLAKYIADNDGLGEADAIRFITQIADALSYMHGKKMLHLDIKPGNMMLTKEGTVKLIDYGLATQYEEDGEVESIDTLGYGTPGYAPMEQSERSVHSTFTPTLDIYALGATYYKMLTCITPPKAIEVLNSGLSTMPLLNNHVSQQSIDAIKAAMEPLPQKRLQSVEEFIAMLPETNGMGVRKKDSLTGFIMNHIELVIVLALIVILFIYWLIFV